MVKNKFCYNKFILFFSASQGDVCLRTTPKGDELHESKGYVQIFDNGKWKNICDPNWGVTEASIVCRQLGLVAVLQFSNSTEGSSNVTCTGKEKTLQDCEIDLSGSHHCHEGVNVTCSTTNPGKMSHQFFMFLMPLSLETVQID